MSERAVLTGTTPAAMPRTGPERDITLLELVDRLLEGGVSIHGDMTLAVADIDLLRIGLRVVVASVDSLSDRAEDVSIVGGTKP